MGLLRIDAPGLLTRTFLLPGLVQAPRYRFEQELRRGTLVEVLPDCPPFPTTLAALFPRSRQMTPRLRVFAALALLQGVKRSVRESGRPSEA